MTGKLQFLIIASILGLIAAIGIKRAVESSRIPEIINACLMVTMEDAKKACQIDQMFKREEK